MAVLALPHVADGGEQPHGVAGEGFGQQHHQHQRHQADDDGDVAQVGLDGAQHPGLLAVVFVEVHRPQRHAVVEDGHRRPGADGPLPVFGAGHVLPPQRGGHLPHEGIAPQAVVQGGAVVEDAGRRVCDQHPGALGLLQQGHGLLHALPGQRLGYRQRGADDQRLPLQVALLGGEHHIFRHQDGVGVHHNQDGRHHQQISQRIFGLDAAEKGNALLPPPSCRRHRPSILS